MENIFILQQVLSRQNKIFFAIHEFADIQKHCLLSSDEKLHEQQNKLKMMDLLIHHASVSSFIIQN